MAENNKYTKYNDLFLMYESRWEQCLFSFFFSCLWVDKAVTRTESRPSFSMKEEVALGYNSSINL